ncbi:MAG: hypothetical protein K1X64_00650 [Myxococcaceae bacterium]|nr:hypothetical protein [Myxococcaceae bacterium]
MNTIKPRTKDALSRRSVDEPAPKSEAPTPTPYVSGDHLGIGALAGRGVQMLVHRPDVLLKRLSTAAYVGVWAYDRYAKHHPAVTSQKMVYELAKAALSETKLGGVTLQAMGQGGLMAAKLAGTTGSAAPASTPTAMSPLAKAVPYLNALAVPLAAYRLKQLEEDPTATPLERNLARASLAFSTVAAASGFTSNPVGWAVSAGAGALAGVSDIALMASRYRETLAAIYKRAEEGAMKLWRGEEDPVAEGAGA